MIGILVPSALGASVGFVVAGEATVAGCFPPRFSSPRVAADSAKIPSPITAMMFNRLIADSAPEKDPSSHNRHDRASVTVSSNGCRNRGYTRNKSHRRTLHG